MEHRDKSVYNLAVKRKLYNHLQPKKLHTIVENTTLPPFQQNIFRGELLEKMENIQHVRSYNMVGKKQVKAYYKRNTKKKQALKRVDSAISNSKQSNTVRSQDTDNNLYLTKEDLLDSINKTCNDDLTLKKCPTLEKVKLKYKKYRNLWKETGSQTQTQNRMNIYELVDESRKKKEGMYEASLKQMKQNIPAQKWKETLRYSFDLSHIYDSVFVEKINKNGINLKGTSKKNKQIDWISNQTNSVFQFYEKDKKQLNKSQQEKEKNFLQTKFKFPMTGKL